MAYQQITLAQLQTLLLARVDNQQFWSSGETRDALNEGISLMGVSTGRWRNQFEVTTVAKRVFYDLTTLTQLQANGILQGLQAIRVSYNGGPALGWSSWSDMDMSQPGWQAQTTATAGAPSTPQMAGPAGLNLLWIWPADAVGNNNLQINFIVNSPQLVNPGDFVNLDNTEITGLLGFGVWRISLKRGGVFFQRTFPELQNFLRLLVQRNAYLANLAPFRQVVGADFARNYAPRRISERTGREFMLGVR